MSLFAHTAAMAALRMWQLLRRLEAELAELPDEFPQVRTALVALGEALRLETPERRRGIKRRRGPAEKKDVRTLRQKVLRWKKKCQGLTKRIREATGATGVRRQLGVDWLVRVALAAPLTSARALQVAVKDITGSDQSVVSRGTIGKIQDAFVQVLHKMVRDRLAATVRSAAGEALAAKAPFAVVVLTHLHDEAALRLRSFMADRPDTPARGRASKVQQHVASLFAFGVETAVPTELEALANKTAATLATSLEGVVRGVGQAVFAAPPGLPIVFTHIVVCDSVASNEAACKMLLAMLRQNRLGEGVHYWLAMIRCATHQANLSAKSCAFGPAAEIAQDPRGEVGGVAVHTLLTGAAARLFKYLINDYHEEFCSNLRDWVLRDLRLVNAGEARDNDSAKATGLAKLYGGAVFPESILALWNNGLGRMEHVLPEGASPEAERERVAGEFVSSLATFFLKVDEKPTVSRFWTFREAVGRMLSMSILGFPKAVLRFKTLKPRQQGQTRLRCVLNFFRHACSPQLLRRVSLSMQLTGVVTSFTGRVTGDVEVPMLVLLTQGEAQKLVEDKLADVLSSLCNDEDLEVGPAVSSLIATAVDLLVRFRQYQEYPCRLAMSCQRWNPDGFLVAIMDFLQEPKEKLDLGYSLPLQRLAKAENRTEMDAIAFMAGPAVQGALESFFCRATISTLEVERRHAQARRWEGTKLTHVAVASRKCFLQRYARERREHSEAFARAEESLRRAKYSHTQNLVWERQGSAVPQGSRWGTGPVAQAAAAPLVAAQVGDDLREEARARKEAAVSSLEQLRLRHPMPTTRLQWSVWMSDHEDEFRALMKTASAERRSQSHRLTARDDLPAPAPRLGCVVQLYKAKTSWGKILWSRDGWFGVRTYLGVHVVFLYHLRGETHVVEMAGLASPAGGVGGVVLRATTSIADRMLTFEALEAAHPEESVTAVFQFMVEGKANLDGVVLQFARGKQLREPVSTRRRPRTGGKEADLDEESDEFDDEKALGVGESASESGGSVDTDVDSESVGSLEHQSADGDAAGEVAVEEDADGEVVVARVRRPPVWSNRYFYILDNSGHPDVKIRMYDAWTTEEHMGHRDMSKTLTPSNYGESRENPARSFVLLRAWMLWRARRDGWAIARPGRSRQFDRDAADLERDIRALPGPLTGDGAADARLREWVPDCVARVEGADH